MEVLKEATLSLGMLTRPERKQEGEQPAEEARKIQGLGLVHCLLPLVCWYYRVMALAPGGTVKVKKVKL